MGAPVLKVENFPIVITEGLTALEVIEQAHVQGVQHLIQKDGVSFEKEKALAELMISNPQKFFDNPLSAILSGEAEADRLFEFACEATAKKRDLLDALEEFLKQHSKSRSVRDEVLLAADEIFTNASKNSGVFYDQLSAPAEFKGPQSGTISFKAYVDSERVVVLCADSYGGLKIPELIEKIRGCYEKGVAGAIQQGDAGAGIGSFLIFNNCSSYYLGVERGKQTIVGVTFQHSPRAPDKTALSKHFNFVSIG